MLNLPFVFHNNRTSTISDPSNWRDAPTTEEPLPPTVGVDASGCTVARGTRYTFVDRETTDDN